MSESWSGRGFDLHVEIAGAGGRRAGLEAALRAAVRSGRLRSGESLPSTRALARELGLSRGTVTATYDQLVEEGYLFTRPGAGTTVAELPQAATASTAHSPAPNTPRHDLRPGTPDLSAFPTRAWLAATRRALGNTRPEVYGAGDPQGRYELRAALADYLGRTRGVLTTPQQIVVTSGFHQSIGLLGQVLHADGIRTVAVEDPGHNAYREVIRRTGLTTVPLAVDGDGARMADLNAEAVVLTPAHQYPTGVPLHPNRRHQVADWARRTGGLVIEDDYDGEFRYDRHPVGALQGIAPDHIAYCGTASKTLAPALRLAWLVLPPDLVRPVVEAKQRADLYTETLGQLTLAELIRAHAYDRHVRAARLRYRRRRDLLLQLLGTLRDFTPHGVPAGLHTLVTTHRDEAELLARCTTHGLALRGLTELYHSPDGRPGGLLIGFAAPSDAGYPRALAALARALG